ncbi:MAG: hypothetical protein ABEJ56_03020 [Candidatus Nanohaloarchaea archaeon]
MWGKISDIAKENDETSFIIYGSYLEKGLDANDIDLFILVDSRENVESVSRELSSEEWPLPLDTEFFFLEEFWRRAGFKDFKFSTAFSNYEVFGAPLDEESLERELYQETPEDNHVAFNFYKSVDAWDKARAFLDDARTYSRREMRFEEFSPEKVYENALHETNSDIVTDSLLKASAALSFSSGYLAASEAYSDNSTSYKMQDAFEDPMNQFEHIFEKIREFHQRQKEGEYDISLLEDYVKNVEDEIETSPFNDFF